MVNLDAAQGAVRAYVLPTAIKRRLGNGLHVMPVFFKYLIKPGFAHLIVFLHLRSQPLRVDSCLLCKFLKGVCLCYGFIAIRQVPFPLLVKMVVQVMGMHMAYNVRTFLFILFQQLAVKDGKSHAARLCRDCIACESGIANLVLGHESLSVAVHPQTWLAECAVQDKVVHIIRKLVHKFHCAGFLSRAGLPCHTQAVPLHSWNRKVENGLSELISCFFFNHGRVVPKAACCKNDGIGPCLYFFPVLVFCQHACCAAVLHDDFMDRRLKEEFHAQFLGPFRHFLGHGRGRPGSGDPASLGLAHMPCELAVRISPCVLRRAKSPLHACKLHAHVHQPVNGIS